MVSPAFLVEGQMEQRILQRICPGQPVRLIGVNGDHVKLEAICDRLETHIRLLGNRHHPIFVVFDRENREASALEIADAVATMLVDRGFAGDDIRVFVADREIEDWMLIDADGICQHYNIHLPQIPLRGKGGLARLIESQIRYHETSVGVELFGIVSKERLRDGCPSFRALYDSAAEIGCVGLTGPLL
jgi:hypothetical protein